MASPSRSQVFADATNLPSSPALVLRQFRLIFNAVKTHFQQVEKSAGLGGAQLWALSLIHAKPGIGVVILAGEMDIHQTTASNLVKSLSHLKLIEVRKEAIDRRAVQLYVTVDGAKVLLKAPGPFTGVLPEALAQLDAQTLARMSADLNLLIDVLNPDERGAEIPLGQ